VDAYPRKIFFYRLNVVEITLRPLADRRKTSPYSSSTSSPKYAVEMSQ